MSENLKQRSEIDDRFKWDIASMYASDEDWEKDLKDGAAQAEAYKKYRGRLGESAQVLADAFEESDAIDQKLERVYVYARMKLDEDNRIAKQQEMVGRVMAALSKASAASSFVMPELISIPEDRIREFQKTEPRLAKYEYILRQALRQKEHVLTEAEENILAQLGEVLGAENQIFTMLNNADMKFGLITDEKGQKTALTHGNYIKFMRSQDRNVRKQAFDHCYHAYQSLINTIAANYSYHVKTDVISSRLRHFDSPRQQALSGGNIPESVYDNLVEEVHNALPALYKYLNIRKKMMGLDELRMWDVYVPLVKLPEKEIPFEEAVRIGEEGLAPLGQEYLDQFQKGIDDRWIDIYENEGKTSGAYSFGSYDSKPFVLMNYDGTLQDIFTLVHEMGHSMNSWYTRRAQPFVYGSHSIFTAEVASTVNETLLIRHLLETEKDPDMRKYLINLYLEEFRATLFRQTMFAEFEQQAHEYARQGGDPTAEWLNNTYDTLNNKYFGDALTHDDLIQYEWARIPHFYSSFYVYQYATGYSAANAIADRILGEGEPAVKDYIEFLKSGDSDDPVELLKIAGVDMSKPEPVRAALQEFSKLVDEFEQLTEGK